MASMECLRIESWDGRLRRETVPVPTPGPNDVLVEVAATGVGRTVHKYTNGGMGSDPAHLPRIPGHELVGTVVEAGAGVDTLDEGDRVAAYFHVGCGRCGPCDAGRVTHCEDHRGHVGVVTDGGFAEYACLPARQLVPVPADIDPVAATAVPDAVATPYHVVTRRADVGPGDHVAVLGAGGGVGIHLLQVARHFGATVTAVDVVAEKLDRCAEVGADRCLDAAGRDPGALLDEAAPYDVVVDFAADVGLLEAGVDRLAPQGRLVNLTSYDDTAMRLAPRDLVRGETTVTGSRYCYRDELRAAAELVADGAVEPVVSEVVGFDEVPALLDRIVAGEVVGRGAMRPV
jgi:propanol-preferring alcohol dehydrogenase